MKEPTDNEEFMVDVRYGNYFHTPGCLATTKPSGPIPPDAGYHKLSYKEIKESRTHHGDRFEPHACVSLRLRNRSRHFFWR